MKRIIRYMRGWGLIFGSALLLLASCTKEEELPEPVDLRFRTEDRYDLPATAPEVISFIVKSSDPWTVYSYHPDWCDIAPASGEPGDKFTVNVQYHDNEDLDDRTDTLVIKSGYWIGKWIPVQQKGIAYLNISEWTGELPEAGGQGSIQVSTNQKWRAEITEGDKWLRLAEGEQGEGDGTVTFAADINKGERRAAQLHILDRHDSLAYSVEIIQNGVRLDPAVTELRAQHDQATVELPVVSNAEWTVTKDDADQEWYSFVQSSFNGDGTLVIRIDKNESTSTVRKATFTLSTGASEEGVEPVVRSITLLQGYHSVPVRYLFNESESKAWSLDRGKQKIGPDGVTFTEGGRYRRTRMANGTYTFKISSMSPDAIAQIHFTYGPSGAHEFRWHVDGPAGKSKIGASPWVKDFKQVKMDLTQPNLLTLILSEAPNGFVRAEWQLNGKTLDVLETTEVKPVDIRWDAPVTMFVGSKQGTVVYEYYEFTGPVKWD